MRINLNKIKMRVVFFKILIILIANTYFAQGQSLDQHYIRVENFIGGHLTSIQYLDDLGRQKQNVLQGQSPSGKDIVSGTIYNSRGLVSSSIAPMVNGGEGGYVPFFSEMAPQFWQAPPSQVAPNIQPWTVSSIEASPLSRTLSTKLAGTTAFGGQTVSQSSQVIKIASSIPGMPGFIIRKWKLLPNGDYSMSMAGSEFPDSSLILTQTSGPGGSNKTITTVGGLTLASIDQANLITLYVYNAKNQLVHLVPPLAVEKLQSLGTYTINAVMRDKYVHTYTYDGYGRIASSKKPHQLALACLYDAYGRVYKHNAEGGALIEYKFDSWGRVNEVYTNGELSRKIYYDSYAVGDADISLENIQVLPDTKMRGKVAAVKSKLLDPEPGMPTWLSSAIGYDSEWGDVIKGRSTNHLNGFDEDELFYDNTRRVLQTITSSKVITPAMESYARMMVNNGLTDNNYLLNNDFTLMANLDANFHPTSNTLTESNSKNYKYNEIGQVVEEDFGNINQTNKYKYNDVGLLTHINQIDESIIPACISTPPSDSCCMPIAQVRQLVAGFSNIKNVTTETVEDVRKISIANMVIAVTYINPKNPKETKADTCIKSQAFVAQLQELLIRRSKDPRFSKTDLEFLTFIINQTNDYIKKNCADTRCTKIVNFTILNGRDKSSIFSNPINRDDPSNYTSYQNLNSVATLTENRMYYFVIKVLPNVANTYQSLFIDFNGNNQVDANEMFAAASTTTRNDTLLLAFNVTIPTLRVTNTITSVMLYTSSLPFKDVKSVPACGEIEMYWVTLVKASANLRLEGLTTANNFKVIVYPNPVLAANKILNVNIATNDRENINAEIIDNAGRVLAMDKFTLSGKVNNFSLDISFLKPGVYMLRLHNTLNSSTQKFVVQ